MSINWQVLTSLAELGTNIALAGLGTAGVIPSNSAALASSIEASVNPLLNAIQGNAPTSTDIQAGYGALIGGLTILKSQTNLDPSLLSKIEVYLQSTQDGLTAYMTEQTAFNAALFTVNAPMTPVS